MGKRWGLPRRLISFGEWKEPFDKEKVGSLKSVICRNLSVGLMTKARACVGAGQVQSMGVTFHAPRSVGECEGMTPHTPK
jgi:hypothetical protein